LGGQQTEESALETTAAASACLTASPNSSIYLRASRVGRAEGTTRASSNNPNIFPLTISHRTSSGERTSSADLGPAVG
jgi:hypothetical protein